MTVEEIKNCQNVSVSLFTLLQETVPLTEIFVDGQTTSKRTRWTGKDIEGSLPQGSQARLETCQV